MPTPVPGTVSVCYLHPGHYSSVFADSLTALFLWDIAHNRRIVSHEYGQVGKLCNSGGLVAGRNQLAQFMCDTSTAEWMLSLDTDMGFDADLMDRLIDAADPKERPVVGALAFANRTNGLKDHGGIRYLAVPTIYDYVESDNEVGFISRAGYERDALVKCDGTGAAALLIHRTVLERIREKFGDHWFDPVTHPTGPTTFSEDLSFCIRLVFCDIPLHVHTGVRTTHDKGGVYLDQELFDAQRAERAKAFSKPAPAMVGEGDA